MSSLSQISHNATLCEVSMEDNGNAGSSAPLANTIAHYTPPSLRPRRRKIIRRKVYKVIEEVEENYTVVDLQIKRRADWTKVAASAEKSTVRVSQAAK